MIYEEINNEVLDVRDVIIIGHYRFKICQCHRGFYISRCYNTFCLLQDALLFIDINKLVEKYNCFIMDDVAIASKDIISLTEFCKFILNTDYDLPKNR